MTKEIKFRAVIGKDTIHFTLNDLINPIFSIRVLVIPWLLKGNVPDTYTGLKDKNGVEIYEGDIVYFLEYNSHASIEYEKSKYVCRRIEEKSCCVPDTTDMCYRETECVVVGNIYENPELLSQVK